MKALVFLWFFAGRAFAKERPAGHAAPAWRPFSRWRRRLSDERVLQSVSDHVLKDIGLGPDQRSFESSARFRG
jgi:uncharacterized protein YjiS (DUF1127 family)